MGKKSGFTLAEIIITLSIIGVIAAMAIPDMIQDVQDKQFKTVWKKTYSDLNQATIRIINDYGGNIKGVCTTWDHNCLRNLFAPYLSYSKSCLDGEAIGNCWHKMDGSMKYLNGTKETYFDNLYSGLILNNGTLLLFQYISYDCSYLEGSLRYCAFIWVDINGFKGPNTVGKDLYKVWLSNQMLQPSGTQGDGEENSCIKTDRGLGCAAQYLYQ